jgi:hypothetical protein
MIFLETKNDLKNFVRNVSNISLGKQGKKRVENFKGSFILLLNKNNFINSLSFCSWQVFPA